MERQEKRKSLEKVVGLDKLTQRGTGSWICGSVMLWQGKHSKGCRLAVWLGDHCRWSKCSCRLDLSLQIKQKKKKKKTHVDDSNKTVGAGLY